ncbi:lysoplasmalogenase [Microbacterium sp.]|uniref:lysoplasmalogenase n=1 Tax=Microbacterium sp. TaxID=51671 RepID=UPI0039E4F9C3
MTTPARPRSRTARRLETTRWWGFLLYAALSVLHVTAITFDLAAIEYPTKLLLMPALGIAAIWALRGRLPTGSTALPAATFLFLALAFSWLGDGAAFFFPFLADELPAMLASFGIAHLLYIALFLRHLHPHPIATWSMVYAAWWGVMIAVLWPHLGALLVPVILYGAVLGGTAVAATRGGTLTAVGGAFFLASDTLLALRLFLPGVSAEATGPAVMIAYTLGQGLLVLGICRLLGKAPR